MNHRARRRLAVAGAAALALAGTACAPPPTGDATETVTLAVPTLQNPFFRELRAGAQSAADAVGVRLDVVAAHNDVERQARQLDEAVDQDSEAVLVSPVDSDDTAAAVRSVVSADIPVVAVDRGIDGVDVASTVTSDNAGGGMQAAFALAESVERPAQVIHLQGRPDTSVSQHRGRGFAEGLLPYDDIEVVAKEPAHFDRERARRLTARLLRQHPRVEAVFAENDQMALGAVDALGERAGTEVTVVGFDGTTEALEAIQDGTMEATVAQLPEQLGRTAVEQAITAIDGGAVAPRVPVGVQLVTADNVGEFLPD